MTQEKIHVFYTDDDRDDLEVFRDAVEKASQEVNLVTQVDGFDLLRLLENPPPKPAMIFLDWNMPGMNGSQVLTAIRTTENTKDIPVIIFSTSNNPGNIEDARNKGANMYITKPGSFSEMVKMISHCLTINWQKLNPSIPFVYSN